MSFMGICLNDIGLIRVLIRCVYFQSYLESAVDASVVTEPAPSTKSTLKGRKLSSHSGKSFEGTS